MMILAMDTSATAASVCLAREDKIIGECFVNTALTHSQTLIPMIEQLCRDSGALISDVEAIAVNTGPGSFTGVRIGVAAAKGLAFAKNLPCVAVSTLESMAYRFQGSDCVVCAVMDARCSQLYNAMFRVRGDEITRLCDDRAVALSDLRLELEGTKERVVLVGDGAALCADEFGASLCVEGGTLQNVSLAPVQHRIQTAACTACAAFAKLSRGEVCTAEALMPAYLRLPQAERELKLRMGEKK